MIIHFIVTGISILIFLATICMIFVRMIKTSIRDRKYQKLKEKADQMLADPMSKIKPEIYCEYCSARLNEFQTKCPNCGSIKQIKK